MTNYRSKSCDLWNMAVSGDALSDAKKLGIRENVLEDIIQQFYELGDIVNIEDDSRVMRLANPIFGGNKYRFRVQYPVAARVMRCLVIEVKVKRGCVLAMVGIFERSASTYEGDMVARCEDMGI